MIITDLLLFSDDSPISRESIEFILSMVTWSQAALAPRPNRRQILLHRMLLTNIQAAKSFADTWIAKAACGPCPVRHTLRPHALHMKNIMAQKKSIIIPRGVRVALWRYRATDYWWSGILDQPPAFKFALQLTCSLLSYVLLTLYSQTVSIWTLNSYLQPLSDYRVFFDVGKAVLRKVASFDSCILNISLQQGAFSKFICTSSSHTVSQSSTGCFGK